MRFFVPDWDDRIDPGYDFLTDRFTLNRDPYADDLYAHEALGDDAYDGLLVSRMALGEAGPKRKMVERMGMRAYLRLPPSLQLFGDCGAFGYLRDREPRFETAELLAYYARLQFDLGVSVDHAILPEFDDQRAYRYDLTLRNAEAFFVQHRRTGATFTPVGAVQGWDRDSYVQAAKSVVAMGYRYIAIGGLARSRTNQVLDIVSAIKASIPAETQVHVFGIARTSLLAAFVELGVTSVDSASPIRQAWLSANENYYAIDRTYTALRIPISDQERAVSDSLVARSDHVLGTLREAEREALEAVRAFDRGELGQRPTMLALLAYDQLLAARLDKQSLATRRELYRETLRDRPWRRCPCPICREIGVEVIIFRGNNRNRRRGFHNLWVVQARIKNRGR